MATIQEKVSGGKLVSCKFRAFLGRDENEKQIFSRMTWHPPEGLTIGKARKAAQVAAEEWEKEARANYQREQEDAIRADKNPVEGMAAYPFERFICEVWEPLYLRDGSHRPSTVTYYSTIIKARNK